MHKLVWTYDDFIVNVNANACGHSMPLSKCLDILKQQAHKIDVLCMLFFHSLDYSYAFASLSFCTFLFAWLLWCLPLFWTLVSFRIPEFCNPHSEKEIFKIKIYDVFRCSIEFSVAISLGAAFILCLNWRDYGEGFYFYLFWLQITHHGIRSKSNQWMKDL